MKISAKTRYGLRAMALLAKSYKKKKFLSSRKISEEEGISQDYLEKIMEKIKEKGLVKAKKGKEGGYILARSPKKIKIREITEVLEKDSNLVFCLAKNKKMLCPKEKKCLSKKVWLKVQKTINSTLNSITLRDLI